LNSSEKINSPYYPRRARWYGRIFYFGGAIRHRLALDRIYLPKDITVGGLIGSFLVPGLAVYLRGPRLYGKMAMAGCALLFTIFIVWLGYPVGNYAFGMMISIHTTGFVYYCNPYLLDKDFWFRIFFTIAMLILFGLVIYSPLRSVIQNYWMMPLRRNGNVIVVEKFASANAIKRGDWVMYSLQNHSAGNPHEGGAVWVREGFGWGPVLAMAGDSVGFSTNSFAVNGVERPLLPHMPTSGNLTVPEKNWFIWPELGISGHGNTSEAVISGTMLQLATVPEDQFTGKPFKRWFWRKQILQ
jgi:hypothetical protein